MGEYLAGTTDSRRRARENLTAPEYQHTGGGRRRSEWCSVHPAGEHVFVTNSSGKNLGNGETFVHFGDLGLEVCMLSLPLSGEGFSCLLSLSVMMMIGRAPSIHPPSKIFVQCSLVCLNHLVTRLLCLHRLGNCWKWPWLLGV